MGCLPRLCCSGTTDTALDRAQRLRGSCVIVPLHICRCSTCLQVAHQLEAPIQPWAEAFWPKAVVEDAGIRPSVAALFAAASPDVVESLCEAHPMLDTTTRSGSTLMELMSLLPPVTDAAACRAAINIAPVTCDVSEHPFNIIIDEESTPDLCARVVSQLQVLGVSKIALEVSGYTAADQTACLLRCVELLLAQQTAPGGMPQVHLTLSSTLLSTVREAALLAALPRCKAGLRSLHVLGDDVVLSSTIVEALAMLHSLEHLELPHFEDRRVSGTCDTALAPALAQLLHRH